MDESRDKMHDEIEKLVSLSQGGSSEAFGKLYDHFVDSIYKYIYYRVGSADAEDLTELVFLKTWENIRQYKHGYKKFSSWIFRIAHNVIIDHYRASRVSLEIPENIQDERKEADTMHLVAERLNNDILEKAMKDLKDTYRQVLILAYINGFSNEEIGFITGRNQAALRILKFRALRSLRKILERMGMAQDS